MEQYIEREKFLKKSAECFGHFGVLVKAIEEIADECTTAEVVPKSVVDLYRKQVDELEDELASTYDKFEKAKVEVAREIFEEIEEQLSNLEYQIKSPRKTVKMEELKDQADWILHEVVPKTIAELKKKYTASGMQMVSFQLGSDDMKDGKTTKLPREKGGE